MNPTVIHNNSRLTLKRAAEELDNFIVITVLGCLLRWPEEIPGEQEYVELAVFCVNRFDFIEYISDGPYCSTDGQTENEKALD